MISGAESKTGKTGWEQTHRKENGMTEAGDNSRQDPLVLFWMIQVSRFRRNFGHLDLAGSYIFPLFLLSLIYASSAIK